MTDTFSRRTLLATGLGAGTTLAATSAVTAETRPAARSAASAVRLAGLEPNATHDQTAALQALVDAAASAGEPLMLPAGRFRAGTLRLRPGTRLVGSAGLTVLEMAGGLTADNCAGITIAELAIVGRRPGGAEHARGLIELIDCTQVTLRSLAISQCPAGAIVLDRCSGRIADCTITDADTGLLSLDAKGLEIAHNTVGDCANNGIQVWRSAAGEDGTIVSANRIERVAAKAGGSGENGNGINVFRAGGVLVSGNRIADCAYSAIRANAASNIQMVGNSCTRIGEVALYAEFGFEGALVASNVIDIAASGIAVTNFNRGGRLAVVQGNLVRNLFRREHEPEDKRGIGISVEADSLVSGNTIEGAETCGIMLGWGRYRRDLVVSGNLVRACRAGILVADSALGGGEVMISGNMISGCPGGAIRAMDGAGEPTGAELAENTGHGVTVSGNVVV